jgi:hypothetical protein
VNELTIREARGHGLSTPFIVTVVLAAAAILWTAPRAAQGDYRDLLIAFIIFQSLWIVLFWRMGVYLFMGYVVLEGFLVNYFYQVPALNVVKDVFVGLLFLSVAVMLITRRRAPIPRLGWVLPFLGFALVYIAEVFNPHLPNILVGLVGLRVTLFYFLLMPVAYWFFDSTGRVVRFFLFMAALSIPVAAFGIVQYFKGPDWMITISPGFRQAVWYSWAEGMRGEPGGLVATMRTFSTFVQTGSFSWYLVFLMLITGALWGVFRAYWQRVLIAAIFLLQFFALLTTGGRTPMVALAVCVVLWSFFQRGSVRLAPALAILPLAFYVATLLLGTGFLLRFGELSDFQYVRARNVSLISGWSEEAMKSDWTGFGAGYACVASRHVVGDSASIIGLVENGLAKERFEAGIPGLILYIVFLGSFGFSCARQAMRVADPRIRWFATPIAAFIVINLLLVPMGTPFDVSPMNVYLWFFAGFLGRAPLLGQTEPVAPAPSGRV